ncbi:hypothetical protein [Aliivibrio fischeri]|uniref:hypothetical protein n=1 Tax=Aliivibrio fischeri TaxID=668 RepID=UPI00147DFA53|nr:hypothetical protein [Aliivibrio fischeri]
MSHAQYTAIQNTRLTDLANVPSGLLIQYLAQKPAWLRNQVFRALASGAWAR